MPIDTSMYARAPITNFADEAMQGLQQGLSMRQMLDQNAKQKSIDNAFSQGMTTGPDGRPTFDSGRTLSAMAAIPGAGKETFDAQNQFRAQDAANLKLRQERAAQAANFFGSVASQVKDQPSYEYALAQAKQLGADTSMMPSQWGPDAQQKINFFHGQALSVKDQLANQVAQQEADAKTSEAQSAAKRATDAHADRISGLQDKAEQKQNLAYTKMRQGAENFRGNKAVANAYEGLRNSDAAMEIINNTKDYNQLNPEQYNLLTAEVAKIATGGAATEAAAHDVRASTAMSKAANFWQSVSGKPTGAQLGEFVQQNKDYLEHLNEVNHKYVDDFRDNDMKAFKDQVRPDQLKEYQQDFPRYQGKKAQAGAPTAPMGPHPADDGMLQWAKTNPSAPGAAAVLKANGL